MKILLSCACLAVLIALAPGQQAYARVFVLSTFIGNPYSTPEGTGALDLIIKEAFRRIGQKAEIIYLPSERGLSNANRGVDDGDFVRVSGLEKEYRNLVMVPEKLVEFEFTVFTKDPSIRTRGWESLKPYNVGIIKGWKILERNISGVRSLMEVKDPDTLFVLLVKGHADVVVCDRVLGENLIKKRGLNGVRALGPPLARRGMYIYLNRRNADLAPRLAMAIRQMKQDGTFQRMESAPRTMESSPRQ
ncbi:MAG: transporter substrate-binding domain-containing protein [Nitrospiraceae bacterium]|nr:transporter substrate-binding domain-containing protein [Nitrospiraceae bacterium]